MWLVIIILKRVKWCFMKKIKYLFFILICYTMMCGFVHENVYLTINDDRSVNFSAETLVSNKVEFDVEQYFSSVNITKKGYTRENLNQGLDYKGVKFSKKFDSIDDLSNRVSSDAPISIEEYLLSGFDEKLLFSKEESFLNNTYKADYKFSVYDLVRNIRKAITAASTISDVLGGTTNNTDETTVSDDTTTKSGDVSELLDELEKEFSFKFIVTLPNKVIESNADEVSMDKRTLTWNISDINYTKNIKFTFDLENKKNHLLMTFGMGACVLIAVAIIVFVIVAVKKYKARKADSVPIHTDYDPSIEELVKKENKLEIVEVDQTPEVAQVENNVRTEETEIKLQEEQTILKNQIVEKKKMFIDDNEFKEKLQIEEGVSNDEVYVDTPEVDDKL
jgi:hypothetical protein